jgi:hypothetical protein
MLLAVQATELRGSEAEPSPPVPYPTGSHLQLVRRFFTTAEGLPADEVRAVAVTRDGAVLAAAGKELALLQSERWVKQKGPSEISALHAPTEGASALAGASNGVWALNNGQWQIEEGGPANVIAFAAEPGGIPWALAPSGVWRREKTWKRIHTVDDDVLAEPHSLLPAGSNEVLVAAETGLFALAGKRRYWLKLEVSPGTLLSSRARGVAWLDRDHFLVATDKGLNLSSGARGWSSFTGKEGLPILDLTQVLAGADGTVWLGSQQGLIRWRDGRWTYLAGKRWLPDDRVLAIAAGTDSSIWAGTPGTSACFPSQAHTGREGGDSAKEFGEPRSSSRLRHADAPARAWRGRRCCTGGERQRWVMDGPLHRFAILSLRRHQILRSQGSGMAFYAGAASTGEHHRNSRFPGARDLPINEPQFTSHSLRHESEWHESTVEKDWYWKGETSSDEIAGHYFGWYVFYELAADDEQKRQVRATCKRVTDHILDHHYYLIDKDGQPTTWGFWGPDRLNDDPKYWEERCLGSLEMLSHLKVAMHIVGDPRYERSYRELIKEHHYALNTLLGKVPDAVSHDAQLLFLSYYPLLQLEKDPGLRAIFMDSIRRTWEMERVEDSPLWNFIFGASTGGSCDVEAAVEALREIPLDFILWKMQNSHRADLNSALRSLHSKPLPWTERVIHKWDKSPFVLDGGSDLAEGDQTVWLLPYWMGRYHRLIE